MSTNLTRCIQMTAQASLERGIHAASTLCNPERANQFYAPLRNSEVRFNEPAGVVVGPDLPVSPIFRRTSEAKFSLRARPTSGRPHRCACAASKRWGKPRGLPYHDALWDALRGLLIVP